MHDSLLTKDLIWKAQTYGHVYRSPCSYSCQISRNSWCLWYDCARHRLLKYIVLAKVENRHYLVWDENKQTTVFDNKDFEKTEHVWLFGEPSSKAISSIWWIPICQMTRTDGSLQFFSSATQSPREPTNWPIGDTILFQFKAFVSPHWISSKL